MKERAKKAVIVQTLATDKEHLDIRAAVYADNLKKCGCEMCRNPRKTKQHNLKDLKTKQELIADQNYQEQLKEL